MLLDPAPPTLSQNEPGLQEVEWVMIHLLNGSSRKRLPKLGEYHSVFRAAIMDPRREHRLLARVHQRAQGMAEAFPDSAKSSLVGPATDWNDILKAGRELDCCELSDCNSDRWAVRRETRLLAAALIYLAHEAQSTERVIGHCRYCWQPVSPGSRFCPDHAPDTAGYWRRRRAYGRERELIRMYIPEIRSTRRAIAEAVEALDEETSEIDGVLLSDLPRYWPCIAERVEFRNESDALIEHILMKLGYGQTPQEAFQTLKMMNYPCYWWPLDWIEAILRAWKHTDARRCVPGQRAQGLHRLADDDRKYVRELAKEGLTQRQIAHQLEVSPATINRVLRRSDTS